MDKIPDVTCYKVEENQLLNESIIWKFFICLKPNTFVFTLFLFIRSNLFLAFLPNAPEGTRVKSYTEMCRI